MLFMKTLIALIMTACSLPLLSEGLDFSAKDISNWSVRYFVDKTLYQVVNENTEHGFNDIPQSGALLASSDGSASTLFYKERIDLDATPWISWSWRVEQFPSIKNEREKSGDDFAGRLYIFFHKGSVLSSRSVNYVWSQQAQKDDIWPNPFSNDKVFMYAIENSKQTRVWRHAQRNIKLDLKSIFGEEVRYLAGIAIMTDSDNSKSYAKTLYSTIRLTKEPHVFFQ